MSVRRFRRAGGPKEPEARMRYIGRFHLLVGAVVYLLCSASDACAWGPGTHLSLAQDALANLSIVPAAVATLLSKFTADFFYGNLAADVIVAKAFCKAKEHCHHWRNGFHLLAQAPDDRGRAFAWGYLCHLAADTVAHNKYVPRQLRVSRTTMNFGHLYWEMRADAALDRHIWPDVRRIVRASFAPHDELMEAELRRTLFSFKTNRRIFRRNNLMTSAASWQRGVRLWARFSRWPLDPAILRYYYDESLERVLSVLAKGKESPVLRYDPVGAASFAHARVDRRMLRQMSRAGILDPYVLKETVAALDPQHWNGSTE